MDSSRDFPMVATLGNKQMTESDCAMSLADHGWLFPIKREVLQFLPHQNTSLYANPGVYLLLIRHQNTNQVVIKTQWSDIEDRYFGISHAAIAYDMSWQMGRKPIDEHMLQVWGRKKERGRI